MLNSYKLTDIDEEVKSIAMFVIQLTLSKLCRAATVTLVLLSLNVSNLFACGETTTGNPVMIGNFSGSGLLNWQTIEFSGRTEYKITSVSKKVVLRAQSNNSASGIICKQRIDLYLTPILKWQWRVDKALSGTHEKQHAGDDFVARLYVVIDGGLFFWKTKALNYVWSNKIPIDELWQNPYGGSSTMMIAVRSNDSPLKTWFSETRNVYKDLERAFGYPVRYIDAIAVMSDTDDTSSNALAFFGDIYFTASK